MIMIEEFNKVVEMVIKKHGPILIRESEKEGIGEYYLTAGMNPKVVDAYCFDIFGGLLKLLAEDKE